MATLDAETPLLDDTVEGVVDYKGQPVLRRKSGGWWSAGFIIGNLFNPIKIQVVVYCLVNGKIEGKCFCD